MNPVRVAATVLALALVTLAATPASSLDRPTWTVGDRWTYATNTTLLPGLNLTGSVTWTVQGRPPTGGPNASEDPYEVVLSGSGSAGGFVTTSVGPVSIQGSWILTGEDLFEPATLQPLSNLLDLSVNGTYGGFGQYAIRLQNTTTFSIVTTSARYPIVAGSTWSTSVLANYTQDFSYSGPTSGTNHTAGSADWTETFAALQPLEVPSSLAAFETLPVTETWPDGSREVSFLSAQVGNAVRTEGYDPGGNLTSLSTLTAYRYQALEAPTFLGLTALQWVIVVPLIAAAVVALVLVRWHRRRHKVRPRDGTGPSDLTSGPRGP